MEGPERKTEGVMWGIRARCNCRWTRERFENSCSLAKYIRKNPPRKPTAICKQIMHTSYALFPVNAI